MFDSISKKKYLSCRSGILALYIYIFASDFLNQTRTEGVSPQWDNPVVKVRLKPAPSRGKRWKHQMRKRVLGGRLLNIRKAFTSRFALTIWNLAVSIPNQNMATVDVPWCDYCIHYRHDMTRHQDGVLRHLLSGKVCQSYRRGLCVARSIRPEGHMPEPQIVERVDKYKSPRLNRNKNHISLIFSNKKKRGLHDVIPYSSLVM